MTVELMRLTCLKGTGTKNVRHDGVERHSIVHLHPGLSIEPIVSEWIAAGRPLIARRRLCSDGTGLVPLGLPLPPSQGKRRLSVAVPPEGIKSVGPPPLLADARIAAPVAWGPVITALVALDPGTRCFGGIAWAFLTGLPYLSATSDLDLLWHASGAGDVARLLPALAAIDADAPMRLDGEIVMPDGLAIQWREWASDAAELLAKAAGGNRLVAREQLFA